MIRSLFRFVLRSAVVVGVVSLFLRLVRQRQDMPGASQDPDRPTSRPAEPAPAADGSATRPAASTAVADKPPAAPWVPPEDSACPATHPVKAKEASGIYHVPGGLSYDRTAPDRCYRDIEAAEADGYRQSKR